MKKIDRREIDRRDTDRRDINRRIAERFTLPLKGKATFTVAGAQDQREITVKNISAYGAYFSANLRPDVSDSVTLHLPVEAEVSENIFGIAVKFEKIPDFG